jgi:tetratricopeptide (TPR) repeat protein
MTVRHAEHPNYVEAAALEQVAFWSPLPSSSELGPLGRQLVRESESNIKRGLLDSALDASLALNAAEPEYIPGFIRTAELLVATSRRDHARRILRSVTRRQSVSETSEFSLEISKVQTHVTLDSELLHSFANQLLERDKPASTEPYVPAAINALVQADRLDESIGLATQWVEVEPQSPLARCYLVRTHLLARDSETALKTIRSFRDEYDADKIWPENIVVSALAAIASENIDPKWLAAGPVCHGLRTGSLNYSHVTAILEFLVPAFESPQRALLFAGLLATNAGDHDEARALFQTTPAENGVESYIRNVGLERAARFGSDDRGRFAALRDIWQTLNDGQVRSLAETGELFDPPASRATVGLAIAEILDHHGSYSDALKFLNEVIRLGNGDSEVVRRQAELLGKSGSQNEALSTLEALVRDQEANHKYVDAADTLDAMIRLVPGNIKLRARAVENFLKVGRFDQAIDQLVMQGRLLHKAGKLTEAEPPIHRAIEIATMTSDWDKVHKLHKLLISFSPDETRLRHAAVATYVQYGHTQEAMNQLREIVHIARKHNNMDEAIAASHQMLALDPNDPATYHQLGELLVSIQEYKQADRVYRRLANIAPDDHAAKAKRAAIAALTKTRQTSSDQ